MKSCRTSLVRGARAALLAGIACLAAPPFAASADAAVLQADFHFNDRLDAPSGQVMSQIGSGAAFGTETVDGGPRRVLTFPAGAGLSLGTAGLAPSGSYSVVMLFRLDPAVLRRKLIDFSDGSSDAGLYLCGDGQLLLETESNTSCGIGQEPPAGSFVQVVLTRDGNEVRGYLGGAEQFTSPAQEATQLGPELRFFVNDTDPPTGEEAPGAVARIRVYDGALTAAEVGALDRVDAVAPDTGIDAGPAGPTNDATPDFAFSGSEPGRFECSVHSPGDAAPVFAPCPSPHTIGPLGDGEYVFEVAAIDFAGNRDGSSAVRSFVVDTIPPRTVITGGPGDTTAANAVFFFSAGGAASFSCSLDGGAWRPCDSPQSYSGLSLGPHRFEVRGVDEAGNGDPSPAAHAWQVLRPGLVIPGTLKQATVLARELVQMRRALSRVRLRSLRRRRAVTLKGFDALTGGTVEVRASARGRRRLVVLAGERELPRAGRYRVRTKVTRKGRRLARRREKLAMELRLSFTDLAGRSLWASTEVTLRR
jgi:hypothetical protein